MSLRPLQIAIDGPIGSGKSTVAKEIARKLHLMLVDAGGLYRTAALIARRKQLTPDQAPLAAKTFRESAVVERQPTGKEQDGRKVTVLLNGEDVSWAIRTHEIDDLVATFGEHKETIDAVHAKERELARARGVVIEGREIGTMVLPEAPVKVYLTADIKKRAERRFQEYERRGNNVSHSEVVRALKERDELDMRRAYAPLRKARDAVLIDTTNKNVDEVVGEILKLVPKEYKNF